MIIRKPYSIPPRAFFEITSRLASYSLFFALAPKMKMVYFISFLKKILKLLKLIMKNHRLYKWHYAPSRFSLAAARAVLRSCSTSFQSCLSFVKFSYNNPIWCLRTANCRCSFSRSDFRSLHSLSFSWSWSSTFMND